MSNGHVIRLRYIRNCCIVDYTDYLIRELDYEKKLRSGTEQTNNLYAQVGKAHNLNLSGFCRCYMSRPTV